MLFMREYPVGEWQFLSIEPGRVAHPRWLIGLIEEFDGHQWHRHNEYLGLLGIYTIVCPD